MAKQLLLVGDSNVRRYFDRLRGVVGEVDFVQVRNLVELADAIPQCKKDYKMITFSFLTNILVDSGSAGVSDEDRLDMMDPNLRTAIQAICTVGVMATCLFP